MDDRKVMPLNVSSYSKPLVIIVLGAECSVVIGLGTRCLLN